MTRKRKPYKTYTKAFKIEALRLMAESDKSSAEFATELGIRRKKADYAIELCLKQAEALYEKWPS